MKPMITRDGLVKILIITAVLVFVFIAAYPFAPAARQSHRLAVAREHATLLSPKITADPRFAHVQLGAYTGDGGVFWVIGNVSSQADLITLQAIVAESAPPIETKWSVEVQDLQPEKMEASNKTP
jgi:hypothetical protein